MKKYLKAIFFTTLLLTSSAIFAQEEDEENPDFPPGDPGVAPIGDYVPLLVVGATILAFRFLPRTENKKA